MDDNLQQFKRKFLISDPVQLSKFSGMFPLKLKTTYMYLRNQSIVQTTLWKRCTCTLQWNCKGEFDVIKKNISVNEKLTTWVCNSLYSIGPQKIKMCTRTVVETLTQTGKIHNACHNTIRRTTQGNVATHSPCKGQLSLCRLTFRNRQLSKSAWSMFIMLVQLLNHRKTKTQI